MSLALLSFYGIPGAFEKLSALPRPGPVGAGRPDRHCCLQKNQQGGDYLFRGRPRHRFFRPASGAGARLQGLARRPRIHPASNRTGADVRRGRHLSGKNVSGQRRRRRTVGRRFLSPPEFYRPDYRLPADIFENAQRPVGVYPGFQPPGRGFVAQRRFGPAGLVPAR